MTSPFIAGLRSVALNMPDLDRAETFYTRTWGLEVVARSIDAIYLRGSGQDHHLLSLHASQGMPRIKYVSLKARSLAALDAVSKASVLAGGSVLKETSASIDPAGGDDLIIRDPDGRVFHIVYGDGVHPAQDTQVRALRDTPIRLAHAVLNTHDVAKAQPFFEQALGLRLIDRTVIMAFMNCNNDHHSIALGITDNNALNHIAFVMPSLDSVMRGGGRMRDAGLPIEWGPGRHGPGDNAFNYFIDPFGVVIEYTAEVEQVDEDYPVKYPEQWKWPAGRVDQWGISAPPSANLRQAQKQVLFAEL